MNYRSAGEVGGFPYQSKLLCYVLVSNDGTISQPCQYRKSDRRELVEAAKKVREGTARLFVAWPGSYRTDLFAVDDITAFMTAFEITEEELA